MFLIGDIITYSCVDPAFQIANNVVRCEGNGLWMPSAVGICTQDGR